MKNPIMKFFRYIPQPPEAAKNVETVRDLYTHWAGTIEGTLPDGPEKSVALRKLLESKDAAVRAVLVGGE